MIRRFPISLKLILTAVTLVAAMTVGFVLVANQMMTNLYAEQAERLQHQRITNLQRRSLEVASHLGETAAQALAGTETTRLHRILRTIVDNTPEILYAAIGDDQGQVLVQSNCAVAATLEENLTFLATDESEPIVAERTENGVMVREITHPIRSTNGTASVLGFLQLAWSVEQLSIDLAEIDRQKERDTRRATLVMLTAGLIAVVAGILAGILAGMGLTRPIRRLAQTARSLAQGQLSARSSIQSRDEIGDLAQTINHMAGEMEILLQETRNNAELEQELIVARNIQEGLLPKTELIQTPGLELCGTVEPASHCGGDWWAFSELTRQRTLVLVGDVTGHGISSAMLTATARSCLDTVRQLTRGDFRVGYLLKILDQLLREGIGESYHMTCFASIYDPLESTMTYANAGHNQPFLLRRTADGWRHGRLSARGNRLGDADGYAFVEHTISTKPQDLLCWFTDGLVETIGSEGREFGSRRLRAALSAAAATTPDRALERVMTEFHRHRGNQNLMDDVTCVIGRITA